MKMIEIIISLVSGLIGVFVSAVIQIIYSLKAEKRIRKAKNRYKNYKRLYQKKMKSSLGNFCEEALNLGQDEDKKKTLVREASNLSTEVLKYLSEI